MLVRSFIRALLRKFEPILKNCSKIIDGCSRASIWEINVFFWCSIKDEFRAKEVVGKRCSKIFESQSSRNFLVICCEVDPIF